MRDRYERIAAKLDQLIWTELWEGFRPYPFALYDQETVYLPQGEIPWDERFLANTAIEFEGEWMAIWHMADAEVDDDRLAASLAHEMFHCYQKEQGETRYPDELRLMAYPVDGQNYQMKYAENKCLAAAVRESNPERQKELLEQFVQLRREREERIGIDLDQELFVETIEGSAEFVGMKALKQLNETKYREQLEEYLQQIEELSPLLFQIRKISYFTGTLFLLLAEEMALPFPQGLTETTALFKLITEGISAASPAWLPEAQLNQLLHEETKRKETIIANFLAATPMEVKQSSRISGYDPMNTFRYQDWMYCTNFVQLTNLSSGGKVFLRGPLLLKMRAGSNQEVASYYWKK